MAAPLGQAGTYSAGMRTSAIVLVSVAMVSLTSCSSPAEPTKPAVTVTAQPAPVPTVTVSAELARTGESPVDEYDAWWFCRGEVAEWMLGTAIKNPTTSSDWAELEFNAFDPSLITGDGNGYRTQIIGSAGDQSIGTAWCVVSGTVAAPVLDDYQYPP